MNVRSVKFNHNPFSGSWVVSHEKNGGGGGRRRNGRSIAAVIQCEISKKMFDVD